jgi:hypothetical protein
VILEGQVFGGRAQDLGGGGVLADRVLQAAQHRGLGLGHRQRLDGRTVAGQVQPGPAADLEHVAGGPGEQAFPEGAQPGLLRLGYLTVVGGGEESGPQGHGCLVSTEPEITDAANVTRRPVLAHEANASSCPGAGPLQVSYAPVMSGDAGQPRVRPAELVAALSLGVDLGFGQPMEHVLRQCLIALRLADILTPLRVRRGSARRPNGAGRLCRGAQ